MDLYLHLTENVLYCLLVSAFFKQKIPEGSHKPEKKQPHILGSNTAFMEPILYLFCGRMLWNELGTPQTVCVGFTSNFFHLCILGFEKKCSRHVFRWLYNSVLYFSAMAIGMRASVQCSTRACMESCVKYEAASWSGKRRNSHLSSNGATGTPFRQLQRGYFCLLFFMSC